MCLSLPRVLVSVICSLERTTSCPHLVHSAVPRMISEENYHSLRNASLLKFSLVMTCNRPKFCEDCRHRATMGRHSSRTRVFAGITSSWKAVMRSKMRAMIVSLSHSHGLGKVHATVIFDALISLLNVTPLMWCNAEIFRPRLNLFIVTKYVTNR